MSYYVVNAGQGRATHIMKSSTALVPGLASQVLIGSVKLTLCGLTASRYVNVFTPAEASCRECRKRWQRAVAAEQARDAQRRWREALLAPEQLVRRQQWRRRRSVAGWVAFAAAVVAATVILVMYHGLPPH